jgi:hypothetical protein
MGLASRQPVGFELHRFELRAEHDHAAGASTDAVVGKFEPVSASKPGVTLRVARKAGACALHGVVEELQAVRPARFFGDPDRRLTHSQAVEKERRNEQDYGDSERFPHVH